MDADVIKKLNPFHNGSEERTVLDNMKGDDDLPISTLKESSDLWRSGVEKLETKRQKMLSLSQNYLYLHDYKKRLRSWTREKDDLYTIQDYRKRLRSSMREKDDLHTKCSKLKVPGSYNISQKQNTIRASPFLTESQVYNFRQRQNQRQLSHGYGLDCGNSKQGKEYLIPGHIEEHSLLCSEVSQTIGIDGGTIGTHKCFFHIPEGALNKDTDIKIEIFKPKPGKWLRANGVNYFPLSRIVRCSPSRQSFDRLITISLYTNYWIEDEEKEVQVFTSINGCTWSQCGTAFLGKTKSINFHTNHFCQFAVGIEQSEWEDGNTNKAKKTVWHHFKLRLPGPKSLSAIWTFEDIEPAKEHNKKMSELQKHKDYVFDDTFELQRGGIVDLRLKDENGAIEFKPAKHTLNKAHVEKLFDGYNRTRTYRIQLNKQTDPECYYAVIPECRRSIDFSTEDHWEYFDSTALELGFSQHGLNYGAI